MFLARRKRGQVAYPFPNGRQRKLAGAIPVTRRRNMDRPESTGEDDEAPPALGNAVALAVDDL
jgi:hypothetical protein